MPGDTWRVLLIDDDEDDYFITKTMFHENKRRKIELVWASTFDTGREKLRDLGFDVVLIDYDLGIGSGIELIREAVDNGYPAPFILFTGRGSTEVDMEAIQAGATLYLTKFEINPMLLERSIRYAIERKRADDALHQSEDKFARAFQSNPAAMNIIRLSDLHYVDVNESFCRLTGYSREEMIDHTPAELNLFPENHPIDLLNLYKTRGRITNHEWDLVDRYGERHRLLLSVDPIEIGGEPSVLATMLDVSERIQAENALRESEARFRQLLETTYEGIVVIGADEKVSSINERGAEILGYAVNEIIGCHFSDFLYEDEWSFVHDKIAERRRDSGFSSDFRMRGKNGREVWVHSSSTSIFSQDGQYQGVMAMFMDITERVVAQNALRETEERLRDFLESTHDSFYVLDRDWRFLYVNRRFSEIVKRPLDEMLGNNIWEIFPRYLGTTLEENYRKAMTERVPVHFALDGIYTPEWYEVSIYPTQQGISVFSVERTKEKIAREELQSAYAKLKAFVDSNIIGFLLGDMHGKLFEVNDYYLNLIGYSRDDFNNGLVNWLKITPPEHLPADMHAIEELKERGVSSPYEKEYLRKDGSRVWVLINVSLQQDETVAAFVLDISQRKRSEGAL